MTNKTERNLIAICVSCFFHFVLLSHFSTIADKNYSDTRLLEIQIDFPLACVQEGKSLALHRAPEKKSRQDTLRKRFQARKLFLEQVADRVHRLRFLGAEKKFIGTAVFQFKIDAAGRFFQIALVQSSGKPDLDRAARNAISAASGKVKRPPILGAEVIFFSLPVKYQYELF